MQFWNELEGRVIENRYPLRRLLRSEGRSAWFETAPQDGETQAAILSLTESLTDADEVTARLQAAQDLKHPNLVEIRRIGKTQLDQTLFVYAVMEPTDQNLSDVLRDRTLSKEEARQVAEAIAGALTAIHQKGLAHGRVEPASVLATGETVKLRSDCLQSPGATRAGDVAGLGATLFQAFTQRKASSADDAQINRIPAPFAEIIRNSINSRWGLAQVVAALRPVGSPQAPLPVPSVAAMPAPSAPAAIGVGASQPSAAATKTPAIQPQAAGVVRQQHGKVESTPSAQSDPLIRAASRPSRRGPLYVAAAVVLALILFWFIARPKTHRQIPSRTETVAQPSSTPLPLPTPFAAQPAQPKPSAANPAKATALRSPKVWRVVAYTYHHQDQAQHKADEVNRTHGGLQAEVFNPSGDTNHFLVVLGGAMDSHDAFQMRDKAIRAGLAADTYVQGFAE